MKVLMFFVTLDRPRKEIIYNGTWYSNGYNLLISDWMIQKNNQFIVL
jgi:hypothetical protein